MNKIRACVIGYGSIGRRHVEVLQALGVLVSVVSRRNSIEFAGSVYQEVKRAIKDFNPNYLVICSETSAHYNILETINKSTNFIGKILIEKPLFHQSMAIELREDLDVAVGYNLRFHPLIKQLHDILEGEDILSMMLIAGQWLPTWRPGTDLKLSYSSKKSYGGGVLRDLSHELDLALMFCGSWTSVTANLNKCSELEIETEDVADIVMRCEKCMQVNIHLNYLHKQPCRDLHVNGSRSSYYLNMISGELYKDGILLNSCKVERNYTYSAMHNDFIASQNTLCDFQSGLEITGLIDRIENCSNNKIWEKNG